MVSLDEYKKAARARGAIEAIQKGIDASRDVLTRVGPNLAQVVLVELPASVKVFQYSDRYPEIRAERKAGEETWSAENVLFWALEVEASRESSLKRQAGLS